MNLRTFIKSIPFIAAAASTACRKERIEPKFDGLATNLRKSVIRVRSGYKESNFYSRNSGFWEINTGQDLYSWCNGNGASLSLLDQSGNSNHLASQ